MLGKVLLSNADFANNFAISIGPDPFRQTDAPRSVSTEPQQSADWWCTCLALSCLGGDAYTRGVSGGERKRVSIIRVLAPPRGNLLLGQ